MSGVIAASLSRWPWKGTYEILDISHISSGSDYKLVTPTVAIYFDDVTMRSRPDRDEPTGWYLLGPDGNRNAELDIGEMPTEIEDAFVLIKAGDESTLERLSRRHDDTPSGGSR